MNAFAQPAVSAIAFQLAGALEDYQLAFQSFLAAGRSIEHGRTASRKLDHILMLKGAMPELSMPAVELLVCHTELVHVHLGAVRCSPGERDELVLRHREAVEAMHARCLRLFCSEPSPA